MSGLELFAAALGVIAVWLTVKQNPWCWPIGLVMVLLYTWVFYDVKLYSDMLLQVVYAALQVYGWWQWTRRAGDIKPGRQVTSLGWPAIMTSLAIGAVGSLLLGAAMAHWTDAAQPWLDAALTGFSLVAQMWMAQKRVQCWPLWIAVDVIFVGLFLYKGLYLTAALYALFTLIAVQGWREWRADPALRA
ncbi:nicotinamide mononucleotide transporter [Pseudomonas marginalis]|jgi:nicotinamide mononucleotide transporter|uniref:nicotinamide riboside transporter PnuC n=1 Tax=Pseudomonas TaxID=286 RepID=UPI00209D378D|nr:MULTISPECIES: nicotinamide riboside transporter PnuC [Pseudomonas]MCP1506402.1 nicotinamide mononucleotide transporter [Pseudomonas marginalis]MCP1523906.1 nicotinamide mononucleotide transporter [Pseudomonas marginalis]MDQ0499319.1 nicotinamide mononucleotide transporter [Pseudomonas marginalis]